MAENQDVILNFQARTEKAEKKIRELETTLKTSAGRAFLEAKAKSKDLEDQFKRTVKVLESGWGNVGVGVSNVTNKISSMLGPINQMISLFHTAKQVVGFLADQLDKVLYNQGKINREATEYQRILKAIHDREERDKAREAQLSGLESKYGVSRSMAERIAATRGPRTGRGVTVFGGGTQSEYEVEAAMAQASLREAAELRKKDAAFLGGKVYKDEVKAIKDANREREQMNQLLDEERARRTQLDRLWRERVTGRGLGASGAEYGVANWREGGSAQDREPERISPLSTSEQKRLVGFIDAASANSQLEKAAGVMGTLADQTNLAGAAFGSFTNAIAAGVDAAIVGGEGIGRAMRKAAAMSLRATAVESSVMAIKETAWALSSLAFGNGKGAGLHFASAAKHAATAVLAGAGASVLGGGGGGGSSGGGGGGSIGGGLGGGFVSGGSQQQNQPITVVIHGDVNGQNGADIIKQIEQAVRTGRSRLRN